MSSRCISCSASSDDVALYRTAPLGQTPANWKCMKCIKQQKEPLPDPETVRIAEIILNQGRMA